MEKSFVKKILEQSFERQYDMCTIYDYHELYFNRNFTFTESIERISVSLFEENILICADFTTIDIPRYAVYILWYNYALIVYIQRPLKISIISRKNFPRWRNIFSSLGKNKID